MYERVIINRKERTTCVDRIDENPWMDEPFLGRRDLFYVEQREGGPERLTFVRHDFWRHTLAKFPAQLWSNFSAMSYKSAFKSSQRTN